MSLVVSALAIRLVLDLSDDVDVDVDLFLHLRSHRAVARIGVVLGYFKGIRIII